MALRGQGHLSALLGRPNFDPKPRPKSSAAGKEELQEARDQAQKNWGRPPLPGKPSTSQQANSSAGTLKRPPSAAPGGSAKKGKKAKLQDSDQPPWDFVNKRALPRPSPAAQPARPNPYAKQPANTASATAASSAPPQQAAGVDLLHPTASATVDPNVAGHNLSAQHSTAHASARVVSRDDTPISPAALTSAATQPLGSLTSPSKGLKWNGQDVLGILHSSIIAMKLKELSAAARCRDINCFTSYSLRREPANVRDANAIQVVGHCADDLDDVLGYLPAAVIKHLAPLLDAEAFDFDVRVHWGDGKRTNHVPLTVWALRRLKSPSGSIPTFSQKAAAGSSTRSAAGGSRKAVAGNSSPAAAGRSGSRSSSEEAEWLRLLRKAIETSNATQAAREMTTGGLLRDCFLQMAHELRTLDGHLFVDEELHIMAAFEAAPAPAQSLFLRLLLRKGPWFLATDYNDYPDVPDPSTAVAALLDAGLAAVPTGSLEWTETLEKLLSDQCRQVALAAGVQRADAARMRKDEILDHINMLALQAHKREQQQQQACGIAGTSTDAPLSSSDVTGIAGTPTAGTNTVSAVNVAIALPSTRASATAGVPASASSAAATLGRAVSVSVSVSAVEFELAAVAAAAGIHAQPSVQPPTSASTQPRGGTSSDSATSLGLSPAPLEPHSHAKLSAESPSLAILQPHNASFISNTTPPATTPAPSRHAPPNPTVWASRGVSTLLSSAPGHAAAAPATADPFSQAAVTHPPMELVFDASSAPAARDAAAASSSHNKILPLPHAASAPSTALDAGVSTRHSFQNQTLPHASSAPAVALTGPRNSLTTGGSGGGGGGSGQLSSGLLRRTSSGGFAMDGSYDATGGVHLTRARQLAGELLGNVIRIPASVSSLMRRMQRMYFLNEAQDLSRFVATARGFVQYPRYVVQRSRSAFATRQDLLDYELALEQAGPLEEAGKAGDWDAVEALAAPAVAAVNGGAHKRVTWTSEEDPSSIHVPQHVFDLKPSTPAAVGKAAGVAGQISGQARLDHPVAGGVAVGVKAAMLSPPVQSIAAHVSQLVAASAAEGSAAATATAATHPCVVDLTVDSSSSEDEARAAPTAVAAGRCMPRRRPKASAMQQDVHQMQAVALQNLSDVKTEVAAANGLPQVKGEEGAVRMQHATPRGNLETHSKDEATAAAGSLVTACPLLLSAAAETTRSQHLGDAMQLDHAHSLKSVVESKEDGWATDAAPGAASMRVDMRGIEDNALNVDMQQHELQPEVAEDAAVAANGDPYLPGTLADVGAGAALHPVKVLHATQHAGCDSLQDSMAAKLPPAAACLGSNISDPHSSHSVQVAARDSGSNWTPSLVPPELLARAVPTTPQPLFLARFCSAWVYAEMAVVWVSLLEKKHRFEEAVDMLYLLLEGHCSPSRRGELWQRLAIDLAHCKRPQASLQAAHAGLNDPWVRHGDRLWLQRRLLRLDKDKYRWVKPLWAAAATATAPTVVIQGRPTNMEIGRKSQFYADNDELVSVEELGLLYYADPAQGGWKGIHDEGRVFTSLFGLLMYDVLFAAVPEVFRTPFQVGPLDLRTDAFYASRRSLIEARLVEIAGGGAAPVLDACWAAHAGEMTLGVAWDRYSLADLQDICRCIGHQGLSVIMRVMAEDFAGVSGGLPDLLLWRPEQGDAKFVEVKGPRDSLSDQQRFWLAALMGAGVAAEVLRVQEPKLSPAAEGKAGVGRGGGRRGGRGWGGRGKGRNQSQVDADEDDY